MRVVHLPADSPTIPVDLREGEIPKGAVYMEARDTLEVFNTIQKEKDADDKEIEKAYQEMIAIGNVRVRKQGEFFGDADEVKYSELKGTLTFYGTDKNPAVLNQIRGQGIRTRITRANHHLLLEDENRANNRGTEHSELAVHVERAARLRTFEVNQSGLD